MPRKQPPPSSTAGRPHARYEREECSSASRCHVWATVLPCSAPAVADLSRLRAGCYLRSPHGCPKSPGGLSANWTRTSLVPRSRIACLSDRPRSANVACFGGAAAARQRGVEAALKLHRHAGGCVVSLLAEAFQVPRHGACFSAGDAPAAKRYHHNHGHQAEVLVPMVEEAVLQGWAPALIHWGWHLTHWTAALLPALFPFTKLDRRPTRPSRHCHVFTPLGTHGGARRWLRFPETAGLMRRAVLRHCGVIDKTVSPEDPPRPKVVLLLRGDTQQQDVTGRLNLANSTMRPDAKELRSFASTRRIIRYLVEALPHAQLKVQVTSGKASLCEQVGWVHGTSLLLSPHGAHLTNGLWLPRGAVLVEVMPWGMWKYLGYSGLFAGGGLTHERLLSKLPPSNALHWNGTANRSQVLSERECSRVEACRLFYRSSSLLYISRSGLCKLLRKHFVAARREDSICFKRKWARGEPRNHGPYATPYSD
ncbi:hypothetical protein AB1Y20_008384 [Prymnesium parvum]|uniref:Uncharacterized protein n=1 Tax=Prymnesium parvum TaxID=97485 RepID=A0AB34ISV7_PRYPA|mmetsp:Transcript_9223/g.22217  ORF Transcript_9223/g.22217 Transcript_9223/m.22217 type:complete len:480 (-) Transcript_9223:276-1715(-)